jgi:hypothetical protein
MRSIALSLVALSVLAISSRPATAAGPHGGPCLEADRTAQTSPAYQPTQGELAHPAARQQPGTFVQREPLHEQLQATRTVAGLEQLVGSRYCLPHSLYGYDFVGLMQGDASPGIVRQVRTVSLRVGARATGQ